MASKTFSFAKSHIKDESPNAQLLSLKLIRVLIQYESISIRQFRNAADTGISHAHSDFAVELSASIAGAVAKRSISRLPGKDEKHTKKIYKETFDILKYYKENFQLVFKKFLDLLSPEFVYQNAKTFFEFALSVNPMSIIRVNEFFGKDVRTELFRILIDAPKPNLKLLKQAAFDEESARDTAGIAVTALLSSDEEERTNACTFFVSLALTYPEVALENLHAAANFISAPPEEGVNVEEQYNSMATLAAIVMAVIEEKNYAAQRYEKNFKSYVENACQKTAIDAYAVPLLLLSASLSEYEFSKMASSAIKRFERCLTSDVKNESKSHSYSMRFLDAALFYLCNVDNDSALNILNLLLQTPLQSMSPASRVFLMHLCVKYRIKSSFLAFIPYISPKAITRSFMSLLMTPMREPEDYFQPLKGIPPNFGSLPFINDERSFGQSILMLLPDAYRILDEEDQTQQLMILLQNKNKIVPYACILELYKNCPECMPHTFHEVLLRELGAKSVGQHESELLAESIGIHCSHYVSALDDILQFLKKRTTKGSCFLEASLVHHVQVSDSVMTAVLYRLQLALSDRVNCIYSLSALNTIYESKSQQLVSLMVGDAQCQLLLNVLYSPHCQDPYTMFLVCQCVERLLPILLPFLSNESTFELLFLITACFRNSIVAYSKDLFHIVLRSSIAFSPKLLSCFPPLKYPMSAIASNELKLSVCGAMADASQIIPIQDLFELVPFVLVLLQRTKDDRAKQFIVALAQSNMKTSPARLTDWFKLSKQILSDNAMPGFGKATCEPNTKVKACALTVMHALLGELIDERGEIRSSCLDDLMTSTIRSVETRDPELHEIAYPLLCDVIDKFKDKAIESVGNVLEVYESQLSIAVTNAFPYSCEIARTFLVEYTTFVAGNTSNPESRNELVTQIIEGLQKVRYHRKGYFEIATKVVEICFRTEQEQEDTSLVDFFAEFLAKMGQSFEELVKESIRLRSQKGNWELFTAFRNKFSAFYERLLSDTVYLRRFFTPEITLQQLSSFFALEVMTSSESWRICAGVAGITSVLSLDKEKPENQLSEELSNFLVHCVCDAINKNTILLKNYTQNFALKVCENGYANEDNFRGLLYSVIKEKCSALVLASVLMAAQSNKEQYNQSITSHIVQMVEEGVYSEDEGIAVCTIVIDKSNDMRQITDELLTTNGHRTFALTCVRRCLEKQQNCCSPALLARLINKTIECGGFDLLVFLCITKDPVFTKVLSRGTLTSALSLCEKDAEICSVVFDFIESVLEQFLVEEEGLELSELLNRCLQDFIHWCCYSATLKQSKRLVAAFARMIVNLKGKVDEEKIDTEKLSLAATYIEKEVGSSKKNAKKIELKSLSSPNSSFRRSSQANDLGEWQSLDDND